MALRQEVSEIISAMRKLGRDIPTVMEELFAFMADRIDGVPEVAPAPAEPVAVPAPEPVAEIPAPEPAPEPVVEPVAEVPAPEPEVVLTPEMLAEPAPVVEPVAEPAPAPAEELLQQ